MLSRVAENLYWISRYIERAENVARLLDVGFHLELDASDVTRQEGDLGPIESVLIGMLAMPVVPVPAVTVTGEPIGVYPS